MDEEIEAISEETVSMRLGSEMWYLKIPKWSETHENSSNAITAAEGCMRKRLRKKKKKIFKIKLIAVLSLLV